MKYLVTGAAGFIGSHVSKRLLDDGHSVTTIDNLSTGFKNQIPDGCEFIHGDLSEDSTIDKIEKKFFDAILHFAGQSSGEISAEDPIADLNSNVVSTIKLLEYARKTGCKRFIYASSMSIYGELPGKECFAETDIADPKIFYSVGKLASENYLKVYSRQYGIVFTALRYFNIYGEGQNMNNLKQGMVSIYLKQFLDNKFENVEIKGDIQRFRDLSHISDIVDVTVESINNSDFFNEIINIGSGVKITVEEIIFQIREILDSKKSIVISKGTPGDQFGIFANVTKLQNIYEKKFLKFNKGLQRTIDSLCKD